MNSITHSLSSIFTWNDTSSSLQFLLVFVFVFLFYCSDNNNGHEEKVKQPVIMKLNLHYLHLTLRVSPSQDQIFPMVVFFGYCFIKCFDSTKSTQNHASFFFFETKTTPSLKKQRLRCSFNTLKYQAMVCLYIIFI